MRSFPTALERRMIGSGAISNRRGVGLKMDQSWQAVLEFWLGDLASDETWPAEQASQWFAKKKALDDEIRRRFGDLVARAKAEELADWASAPRSLLALLILLDQFTRNIFRGTPEAFAADPLARRYALAGIERGYDQSVRPLERVFYYLPLEHAEDLELQQSAVALFEALVPDGKGRVRAELQSNLDYARRHRDVIRRFGRFPHRNEILGRESTPEEREFLQQPGSMF